jgi:hypothetical protein
MIAEYLRAGFAASIFAARFSGEVSDHALVIADLVLREAAGWIANSAHAELLAS